MFKNNKNNEEVIRMEQTTFIQRHAKKILAAGGLVVSAGAAYMLYKHNEELAEHALRIAVNALSDTIENYDFEINELIFKRDNLNESQVNIFVNIPKLNEEIELKTNLRDKAVALLEKAIENGKTE